MFLQRVPREREATAASTAVFLNTQWLNISGLPEPVPGAEVCWGVEGSLGSVHLSLQVQGESHVSKSDLTYS